MGAARSGGSAVAASLVAILLTAAAGKVDSVGSSSSSQLSQKHTLSGEFGAYMQTTGCLDLVKDCGAISGGEVDANPAFESCQAKAAGAAGAGCVNIPGGTFATSGSQLNASNVAWRFNAGAVLLPWRGLVRTVSLLTLGGKSSTLVSNVMVAGPAGGAFTCDLSDAFLAPWNMRCIEVLGAVTTFTIANLHMKMSISKEDATMQQKPGIGFDNALIHGHSYNPSYGHVANISAEGSTSGYGLTQLQSCEHMVFENLDGTGGVALRMETGYGQAKAYVGNITARNVTCRNGVAALMAQPHQQQNGLFHLYDLQSHSCWFAALLQAGYPSGGKPAGHYQNGSTIDGLASYWGTGGMSLHQRSPVVTNVTSCGVCGNELGSPTNYEVIITRMQSSGFPSPTARDKCVQIKRLFSGPDKCPWDNSTVMMLD